MTHNINKSKIKHICGLANLKLSSSEKEKFAKELTEIINYVDKLNELDTEGVEATAYPVPLKNVLRDDKVEDSLEVKKALENAPEKFAQQFKVPPIMNESDNK